MTFVLDEVANTAPIPLPNVASEAGGQGLHLVVGFQDLSQARTRWGQAADGFLTLFPEKLILSGMNDRSTADMLVQDERGLRPHDRRCQPTRKQHQHQSVDWSTALSTNRGQPSYSYQTTRTPVLSIADITGVPAGQGLYYGPHGWSLLTLNPWWRQRHHLGLF